MIDFEVVKRLVGDEIGLRNLFFEAAVAERKMPRAYDLRVRGYWPERPLTAPSGAIGGQRGVG